MLVLQRGHNDFVYGEAIRVCFGSIVSVRRSIYLSLSSGMRRFLHASRYGEEGRGVSSSIGNFLSSFQRRFRVVELFSVATIAMDKFRGCVVYVIRVLEVLSRKLTNVSGVSKRCGLFLYVLLPSHRLGAYETRRVTYVGGPN